MSPNDPVKKVPPRCYGKEEQQNHTLEEGLQLEPVFFFYRSNKCCFVLSLESHFRDVCQVSGGIPLVNTRRNQ